MPHTLSPDPSAHRKGVIAGLRQLADALDANEDLPVPRVVDITWYPRRKSDVANAAEVWRVAKILGVRARTDNDAEHIRAVRRFEGVTYRAVAITQQAKARWDAMDSYRTNVNVQPAESTDNRRGGTAAPNAFR